MYALLTYARLLTYGRIKSDTYSAGNFTDDPLVEAMLSLTSFQDHDLTAQVERTRHT